MTKERRLTRVMFNQLVLVDELADGRKLYVRPDVWHRPPLRQNVSKVVDTAEQAEQRVREVSHCLRALHMRFAGRPIADIAREIGEPYTRTYRWLRGVHPGGLVDTQEFFIITPGTLEVMEVDEEDLNVLGYTQEQGSKDEEEG